MIRLRDLGFREGINEVIAVTFGVSGCDFCFRDVCGVGDLDVCNSNHSTHSTGNIFPSSTVKRNTAPLGIIVEDESSNMAKVRLFYVQSSQKSGIQGEKTGKTEGEKEETREEGRERREKEKKEKKKEKKKTHTMENVERGSRIHANVCFDPMAFAISAFEDLDEEFFSSDFVLRCACSVCTFEVREIKKFDDFWLCELEALDGRILNRGVRAFSRGFAAVVEAAVHATRYIYTGERRYLSKVLELGDIVERCGGRREREAYAYILNRTGETSF